MSLEQNKNNVELKELWTNAVEAGRDYDNIDKTFDELTKQYKLKLKEKIEELKENSQYESQSTNEEKLQIEIWYKEAIS
jgi:hypothetical protein